MSKIAALSSNQIRETFEDEIAFASIARNASKGEPGFPHDRRSNTIFKIASLMPGEKKPRSGAHPLGIDNIGLTDAYRCDWLHIGHLQPPRSLEIFAASNIAKPISRVQRR